MDFKPVREALRRARVTAPIKRGGVREIGMTLDEAAEKSGLNRATIHSVENLKREPDLKPELETLELLGRAYGLVLSLHYTPVVENSDLNSGGTTEHNPTNLNQTTEAADGRFVSDGGADDIDIALAQLARAIKKRTGSGVGTARQQIADPRLGQSRRRRSGGGRGSKTG